jgi:glycosyltransferase involved in cell wall biosynthesis
VHSDLSVAGSPPAPGPGWAKRLLRPSVWRESPSPDCHEAPRENAKPPLLSTACDGASRSENARRIGRVLVVLTEGALGGAEAAVVRAIPEIRRARWDVVVWCPPGVAAEGAERRGAEVITRWRPIRYSLRGFQESPGFVRRIADLPGYTVRFALSLRRLRPNVVHVNTIYALPEALIARLLGFPVVLHIHDIPPSTLKTRLTTRAAGRLANEVVACSAAAVRGFEDLSHRRSCHVVYNGVPATAVVRSESTPLVVGMVGTIQRRKGTDLFVAAAKALHRLRPELRFVVLGSEGGEKERAFIESVRDDAKPLGDAFTFATARDVPDAIRRWAVFVLPSREDPFPLAILEALEVGLPIVATRVGGIPEQIEHEVSGYLVEPESPEALVEVVSDLLADAEKRWTIGLAAAQGARAFSLTSQAVGLVRAYRLASGDLTAAGQ